MKPRNATLCAALFATLAGSAHAAPANEPQHIAVDFSSCGKPAWPQDDLKARHTGTVTLSFTVDASGSVSAKCKFRNGPGKAQLQYVWTLE